MKAKTNNQTTVKRFLDEIDRQMNIIKEYDEEVSWGYFCSVVEEEPSEKSQIGGEIFIVKAGGKKLWLFPLAEGQMGKNCLHLGEVEGYITHSGTGIYYVYNKTLYFEGHRGSFYAGCGVFSPHHSDEWELIESKNPEWGVWNRPENKG